MGVVATTAGEGSARGTLWSSVLGSRWDRAALSVVATTARWSRPLIVWVPCRLSRDRSPRPVTGRGSLRFRTSYGHPGLSLASRARGRHSTPTRGRPQRGSVGFRARRKGLTGPWWGSGLGSRCWAPGVGLPVESLGVARRGDRDVRGVAGSPATHYHTYRWAPGKAPQESESHLPGEYIP